MARFELDKPLRSPSPMARFDLDKDGLRLSVSGDAIAAMLGVVQQRLGFRPWAVQGV